MANGIQFEFGVEGQEELNRKLNDPQLISVPTEEIIETATIIGAKSVRATLRDKGTGLAERTVRTKVEPMQGRVYSLMSDARIESMHEGRRAGTRLPYVMVARWVLERPYLTRRRMDGPSDAERSTVISAWHAIEAGGAKAVPFFPKAREAIERALPRLIAKASAKMQKRFDGA